MSCKWRHRRNSMALVLVSCDVLLAILEESHRQLLLIWRKNIFSYQGDVSQSCPYASQGHRRGCATRHHSKENIIRVYFIQRCNHGSLHQRFPKTSIPFKSNPNHRAVSGSLGLLPMYDFKISCKSNYNKADSLLGYLKLDPPQL